MMIRLNNVNVFMVYTYFLQIWIAEWCTKKTLHNTNRNFIACFESWQLVALTFFQGIGQAEKTAAMPLGYKPWTFLKEWNTTAIEF